MKFLVKAVMPVEAGNALVRDPNIQSRMDSIVSDIRPEAAYFTIDDGQRTAYLVVNVEDTLDPPRIAEPLWQSWQADATFIPVIPAEDMEKLIDMAGDLVRNFRGADAPLDCFARRFDLAVAGVTGRLGA